MQQSPYLLCMQQPPVSCKCPAQLWKLHSIARLLTCYDGFGSLLHAVATGPAGIQRALKVAFKGCSPCAAQDTALKWRSRARGLSKKRSTLSKLFHCCGCSTVAQTPGNKGASRGKLRPLTAAVYVLRVVGCAEFFSKVKRVAMEHDCTRVGK